MIKSSKSPLDFTRFDNITNQAHIPVTILRCYLLLNPEKKKSTSTCNPYSHLCINDKDYGGTTHDDWLRIKVGRIEDIHMVWSRQIPNLKLNKGAVGDIWSKLKFTCNYNHINDHNIHKFVEVLPVFYQNKFNFKLHKSFYLLSLFCLWLPGIKFHSVKLCEKQLFVLMFFHS